MRGDQGTVRPHTPPCRFWAHGTSASLSLRCLREPSVGSVRQGRTACSPRPPTPQCRLQPSPGLQARPQGGVPAAWRGALPSWTPAMRAGQTVRRDVWRVPHPGLSAHSQSPAGPRRRWGSSAQCGRAAGQGSPGPPLHGGYTLSSCPCRETGPPLGSQDLAGAGSFCLFLIDLLYF